MLTVEDVMPEDFHLLVNSKHPLGGLSEAHALAIERRAVAYVKVS